MIKYNFLLWGILELKLNPRRRDTKTLSGVAKITSKLKALHFSSTLESYGIST
jgi:hypothetical protein